MPIYANEEQRLALSHLPDNIPLYMVNLLKYRERAVYDDGDNEPSLSGRDAYHRYGEIAARCIRDVGGRIIFFGQPALLFIGEKDEFSYDSVVIVEYPSRSAFSAMQKRPEFLNALRHRKAGLDRQILSVCVKEDFSLDSPHVL